MNSRFPIRFLIRFLIGAATVAFIAGSAVACSGETKVVTQAGGPNSELGIAVSGHGEITAPSDTGFFDVGVQARNPSVAAARDNAAKAADAVIKSLKADGVDEKEIKTTQLTINPEFDNRSGAEPRITGYLVTNTVNVKVTKLDNFSKIIDDAIAAGGDATRIQSIRFDVQDNAKFLEQARKAAMDDAQKKATQLAAAGGVKVGKPVLISENQSTRPQPIAFAASDSRGASQASPPTPIQAGTGTIVVEVTVRYLIDG